MKNIFEKLISKVLPFVLCICIVSGAAAPAYADSTTSAYGYYFADSNLDYILSSGTQSADVLGNILRVLSYNQKKIYDKLSVSGGTDYSSVLNNIFGTLSNLNNKFNAPVVTGTDKLFFIGDTLSYINKPGWTNGDGLGEQLQSYMSAMSYNLVSTYNNIDNIKSELTTQSAILDNNLPGIKSDLDSIKNRFITDSLTQYYNRFYRSTYDGQIFFTSGYGLLSLRANQSGYYVGYNTTENFTGVITNMNNSLVQLGSEIFTPLTVYKSKDYDVNTNSVVENNHINLSIMDMLYEINHNVLGNLSKLAFVLADDNTIAAKKANQAQEQAVLNNFTGSGSASATASDFGAVKDSIVDFKAGFSGGASSSDTFSFMSGDSNAWDWFTQDTANDLDRTQGSNTRLLRGSSDVAYDTPLLDSYYNSILSILGGED